MSDGAASGSPEQGLHFYGVMRARIWGGPEHEDGPESIRHRDLEAIVRRVPYEAPAADEASVRAHQRTLEAAMRLGTVLPAPFGIVFRDRRHVIRMLEDQYAVLDDGLAFLDDQWEVRLHIARAGPDDEDAALLGDAALRVYTELRRAARAAVPFPRANGRVLSAAFLVDRGAWLEFLEQTDALGRQHPELSLDVTGPWPAYDFVRVRIRT